MSNMRRLLESMDKISKPAKKSTGPKFPGYWKGTDDAAQARDKMVGSAQESVIPELAKQAKEKTLEWKIQEAYQQFKEQGYSGVDPVVRQRMGMQPATQGEVQTYLDKNPPGVTTSTGQKVTTGSEVPVVSGGLTDVAKAADAASPDRTQNTVQTPTPAASTLTQPAQVPVQPISTTKPATTVASNTVTAPVKTTPAKPIPTMPQKVTAGSWQDIWKNNPSIKNPNLIYTGQEIKLPNGTSTIVDKGDTLSSIAQRYRQGGYNVGTEVEPAPAATKTSATTAPVEVPTAAVSQPGRYKTPQDYDKEIARFSKTSDPTLPPNARYIATLQAEKAALGKGAAAGTATAVSNPTVNLGLGDPGYTPLVGNKLEKRSDGKWYYPGNKMPVDPRVAKHAETQLAKSAPQPGAPSTKDDQAGLASYNTGRGKVYAADVNNPSGLGWDGKGKYTSYKTPEEGVNATKDLVTRYLTNQTSYIKGAPTPEQVVSTWASGGAEPAEKIQGGRYLQSVKDELAAAGVKLDSQGRIPYSKAATDAITRAIVRHETSPKHMDKFLPYLYPPKNEAVDALAEQFAAFMEAQDPYGPEYQDMVKRVGQRAKQGPLKTVWDPVKRVYKNVPVNQDKKVSTSEAAPSATTADAQATNPNAQATNPNAQITQRADDEQDNQAMDSVRDVAVAASTVGGLKNVLGPQIDQRTAATAMNKMTTGQAMNPQEQQAISSIVPLMAKAAQEPSTAGALRSALQRAGTLAKQGK